MNQLGARSNTGEGGEDPAAYQARRQRPRRGVAAQQQDQAGRFRSLRRHRGIPHPRRRVGDQDRARLQARRRRPASRTQGQRTHRAPAPRAARRFAHQSAAASRHLQHRRPGAAHLRLEAHQPARARRRETGIADWAWARLPRASPRRTPTTSLSPDTAAAPARLR